MPILVTFDGPKGVGKSTLLQLVAEMLRSDGYLIEVLIEKDLMSEYLGDTIKLAYTELKTSPCKTSDLKIALLHKQGRLAISNEKMRTSCADILLIDRWYPSDSVFRNYIDTDKIIDDNIESGVFLADICFAVTCDPIISWQRAHKRERQLDSKVIKNYDEHVISTKRFEQSAEKYKWQIIRSDTTSAESLCVQACSTIKSRLTGRCT